MNSSNENPQVNPVTGNDPPVNNRFAPPFPPNFSAPTDHATPHIPPAAKQAYKNVHFSWIDAIAYVICFLLTFYLIKYTAFETPNYKTTIIYFLFFALATAYIILKQKKISLKAVLPGALALISSVSFALHDETAVNDLIFVMIMYLSGSYCLALTDSAKHKNGSYFHILDVLKCEVLLALKNIFLPAVSFVKSFSGRKKREKKKPGKKWVGLLIGFAFAVPLLAIIIPLLISGDAAFESVTGSFFGCFSSLFEKLSKLIGSYFDKHDPFESILYFIPACIFAPYIFSVMFCFRHGIANEENKNTGKRYEKLRFASPNILAGFLGVISLVYIIYLLSQTAYFFSAFAGHLPGGIQISVTQYARRGFFEMTKIAGINFVIIAMSVIFGKRKSSSLFSIVKWFDLFLCVFTELLIATSISKILLYITSMGLTEKRLYVLIFDIVLSVVFLCVIIRLFRKDFPYMTVIVSFSCVALTLLGLLGTGNIIAKYNTKMYLSGKLEEIDINSVGTSIKELDKLSDCDDVLVSSKAKIKIADCLQYYLIDKQTFTDTDGYSFYTEHMPYFGYLEQSLDRLYIENNFSALKEKTEGYFQADHYFYLTVDDSIKIKYMSVYLPYSYTEEDRYMLNECIPAVEDKNIMIYTDRLYIDSFEGSEKLYTEKYISENSQYFSYNNFYNFYYVYGNAQHNKFSGYLIFAVDENENEYLLESHGNCAEITKGENGLVLKEHGLAIATYKEAIEYLKAK